MTEWIYPTEDHDGVALALQLGYTHALTMDAYDQDTHARNRASWILPPHPFTRVGPLILVHELILDAHGNSQIDRRGTGRRTRLKVRLDPRLSPRTWYKTRHKGWGGPPSTRRNRYRRGSRSQVRGVQDLG